MPPQAETKTGNRQRFPIPTAEPIQARINPIRESNPSAFPSGGVVFSFITAS